MTMRSLHIAAQAIWPKSKGDRSAAGNTVNAEIQALFPCVTEHFLNGHGVPSSSHSVGK